MGFNSAFKGLKTCFSFPTKMHVTKTYRIVEVELPDFSVAKPHWKASYPGYLAPGERFTSNFLTGGWFGPRTSLESVERRDIDIPAGKRTQVALCSGP